ncbi:hypothetical protein [Sphingomonas sp. Leaf20]|uniref:hypothetical protein n=1 Tax=Sphingomonas sp. Leaf20 TaxID=1735685 RepID=UPI0006F5A8BC|nr:hypothetical protein [Sphingomonas sp. Leaf20]KQM72175.1 hypothetical protein ASE72_12090 [Sphingomonas sp. Leaf20]
MSAAARFKEADVTRAVRGAAKAGMMVGRIEIDPNGKIVILSQSVAPPTDPNPWDIVIGKA